MIIKNPNYDVLEYPKGWTIIGYKPDGTRIFVSQNMSLEVAEDRAIHFLDNNKDFEYCRIEETKQHFDVRRRLKNE